MSGTQGPSLETPGSLSETLWPFWIRKNSSHYSLLSIYQNHQNYPNPEIIKLPNRLCMLLLVDCVNLPPPTRDTGYRVFSDITSLSMQYPTITQTCILLHTLAAGLSDLYEWLEGRTFDCIFIGGMWIFGCVAYWRIVLLWTVSIFEVC